MASGSLFDPGMATDPGPHDTGARPFLSRTQMIGLRAALVVYALTLALLLATNVRSVADTVFRLSVMHLAVRLTIGLMGASSAFTFFLLLGMSLYHFFRGHLGPRPPSWWFWVIVLLNGVGVVLYYLRFIEPEQRSLIRVERSVRSLPCS
jgi:hypothetical protein